MIPDIQNVNQRGHAKITLPVKHASVDELRAVDI